MASGLAGLLKLIAASHKRLSEETPNRDMRDIPKQSGRICGEDNPHRALNYYLRHLRRRLPRFALELIATSNSFQRPPHLE